ncbi:MAG: hypothetical protein RBT59_09410 [Arcobacteraceae bacterium]|jgi:hypothetical protein|nr:hypothetical protein [Arcobacteraceae bacterium]
MKNYNEANERQKIWNEILNLSTDKKECELKLQKLFSFKNFSSYFDKLENTNYILEKFTQPKNDFFINSDSMNEIIFLLLDNLIEFEYFHSFGLKQDGYDYLKLKSRYEEIKKFIPNSDNTKPNYPTHPSIIYRDTLTQISRDFTLMFPLISQISFHPFH